MADAASGRWGPEPDPGRLASAVDDSSVMAGPRIGVRGRLVPAIHVFAESKAWKTWMAGTRPAMTNSVDAVAEIGPPENASLGNRMTSRPYADPRQSE